MHLPSVIQSAFIVAHVLQQIVTGVIVDPIRLIEEKAMALKKVVYLAFIQLRILIEAHELGLAEIKNLLLIILDDHVELQIVGRERYYFIFINALVSAK